MRICVVGLWHLGAVTAACLAELGHQVIGTDFDASRVTALEAGEAPVFEPGLEQLLRRGLSSGHLRCAPPEEAVREAQIVWIACDTPVDDEDEADTGFVIAQIERAIAAMSARALMLVSSQLPVGSIRGLGSARALQMRLACCPENLRLGTAVADFLHPRRLIVGVASQADRELLHELLSPLTPHIEWMSIESAEMTKHAVNAFLATSIALTNEIASVCESVGADATEVARGLRSEPRIGPGAYVSPGSAFSGGTLARDVASLSRTARERALSTPVLSSVLPSNEAHKGWARAKLSARFADLAQVTVAVWGLTYKAGTDTLRRSAPVELCDWLLECGARVRVHDPLVRELPQRWSGRVTRVADPLEAVVGAAALLIATGWAGYRDTSAERLLERSRNLLVLDPNRCLPQLAIQPHLQYLSVGQGAPTRVNE